MWDYEPSTPILLGVAFALCYWVFDTLLYLTPTVNERLLLVISAVMVTGWTLLVAYLSSMTLRRERNVVRRTVEFVVFWVVLFGATSVTTSYAFGALVVLIWPGAMATTFWFGMIFITTLTLGAISISLAGTHRWFRRRSVASS